jgi:hypothetical protein
MAALFAYPEQAAFGRVLPKSKIYTHAAPSARIRGLFVAQVNQIFWRYKLAPETLRLEARPDVPEIEVFEITLKTPELFGNSVLFENPKPVGLLRHILEAGTDRDSIVLDFFAGASTTAHAVMQLNAEDGGSRRFIMVQLPESTGEKSEAAKAGFATISEVSKERIRRVGPNIGKDISDRDKLDIGFRVLKVDSSNMRDVFYRPDEVKVDDLLAQVDNIKSDRTPEDLLFQILLDWGVDLGLTITKETIADKVVFFVDGNAVAACFDRGVEEELVRILSNTYPTIEPQRPSVLRFLPRRNRRAISARRTKREGMSSITSSQIQKASEPL